ncbi:MAG: N-6 DNA methylase [Candidatus Aenigmatarchaeota archaeon]
MEKELSQVFEDYKKEIIQINTHTGKFLRISKFLEEVFGVSLTDVAFGAEKYLKSKVYCVRGRTDLLFGNVILEIKVDLNKELEDAKNELEKYFKALKEIRKEENFVGIITDGAEFRAYILSSDDRLKEISKINISESFENIILWLDSYFFTKRDLKPTAEDIQIKFGLKSPTYSVFHRMLKELFEKISHKPHNLLKFELWKKHLEIVYGSAPDLDEFIDHTYLITLVKLIMYLRLHREINLEEIEKVLNGSFFKEVGITNFIEEDFFSWILEEEIKDIVLESIKRLLAELDVYNFEEADEDLFKEIYQDIIGPRARHRIGEYYTPEWLAQLIIVESIKLLKNKTIPKILDPACGSGTFLTNAIHYFIENLRGIRNSQLLEIILSNIMGMDINPLAVIIARANYIITLGELIRAKKSPLTIPVYLADSIKLPVLKKTFHGKVNSYEITIGNGKAKKYLLIPEEIVKDESLLNEILSKASDLLIAYKLKRVSKEIAEKTFGKSLNKLSFDSQLILKHTFQALLKLIDEDRDTIWVFILRNFYAPIRFSKEKFNLVIGNPPWIAFRYIENKEYQEDLKKMIFDYHLLSPTEVHLFTQMEVATLFYRRCADLYLDKYGVIGFVMPRSVLTGAKHHQKFKEFSKPPLKLSKIIDLEYDTQFRVRPLFNVPSCVLFAVKGDTTKYPVKTIAYSGCLIRKNSKLSEISSLLETREYKYYPPAITKEKSYYYELFKAGAAIYPRPLWFIDFEIDPRFGIDPLKPKVVSSKDAIKNAKSEWKKVVIKGNIENKFIFATLLSKDLKPFGYEKLRPVILPVKVYSNKFKLVTIDMLKREGSLGMAEWLQQAQNVWNKYATKKDKKNFPSVELSINHLGLLEQQNPSKRFVVVSASSGTHTVACTIDKQSVENFIVNNDVKVKINGIILEKTTFFFETNNEEEAHYLTAIINSTVIDKLIKPFQAKGSFGARHIQRLPLELPISKFNPKDPKHKRLAELGKICTEKVKQFIKFSRLKTKEKLKEYLSEIDGLVREIIET